MADALPLHIRYQPVLAGVMLVCSLFILATSAFIGVSINTITGVIILFVSIGYFTQPAIVVTPSAIEHRNLFGTAVKRQEFASLADVTVQNGTFFVERKGGAPEKAIGSRFHLNGADLAKLEAMVRAARGE